ncbi:DUF1990 family protein [Streptomyces sp. NPDC048521]|uniref:DUF1990 family protein n=1 Tax=Streptomyces sp. NPDC048521 TaxID=3365566 RepID=UPI00371233EF
MADDGEVWFTVTASSRWARWYARAAGPCARRPAGENSGWAPAPAVEGFDLVSGLTARVTPSDQPVKPVAALSKVVAESSASSE